MCYGHLYRLLVILSSYSTFTFKYLTHLKCVLVDDLRLLKESFLNGYLIVPTSLWIFIVHSDTSWPLEGKYQQKKKHHVLSCCETFSC